ncbi:hypothetical protein FQZ97_960070 [compost metagenome]
MCIEMPGLSSFRIEARVELMIPAPISTTSECIICFEAGIGFKIFQVKLIMLIEKHSNQPDNHLLHQIKVNYIPF